MYPNNSDTGRKSAIVNRAVSMIRSNLQNQGSGRFMRNYQRIVRAKDNMLNSNSRAKGLANG